MSGIPDVPPTTPDMRQFLLSLKSAVENINGTIEQALGVNTDADLIPPAAPINLSGTSASGTVSLVWTNPGDEDLLLVEVWENTVNVAPNPNTQPTLRVGTVYAVPGQTGTFSRTALTTGAHLYYWVRAVDTSGNYSDYNASGGVDVYVTAGPPGTPGTAPGVPTSVAAIAGFQDVWLTWVNPTDSDLDRVYIFENTVNNSATATIVGVANVGFNLPSAFNRAGLANNVTRYYWLKAADVDGNLSAFSAGVSATTSTVSASDLGTVIGYAGTSGLTFGSALVTQGDGMQAVIVNGSWTAIADSRNSFYEIGIIEAGGSEVIFATSNNFFSIKGRGNTTYDFRVRGVDRNGNRTAWSTTTSITSATQTIGPAEAVNARSTLIDPGRILISGASTLSSWRNGGDNTKIEGGQIAANTVSANKVEIGIRGVSIQSLSFEPNSASFGGGVVSANWVAWSGGTIVYVDDTGATNGAVISAGTIQNTGTAQYIYWTKGATTLSVTTSSATAMSANNIVMAMYSGGAVLLVNYGKTIIEGDSIKTGSVNADRLQANTITTNLMAANTINGDRITANTLNASKIVSNSITATQIAANTITAGQIAASTITATEIAANTITASKIVAATITANEIIGGAVTTVTSDSENYGGTLTSTPALVITTPHTTTVSFAPHVILLSAEAANSGAAAGVFLEFYVDGVSNSAYTFFSQAAFTSTGTFIIMFQPAAGAHTYTVYASKTTGSGTACVLNVTKMIVMELKR